MEKFYKVIDSADIANGSKALYKRQLAKLFNELPKKTFNVLNDVPLIQKKIESIYSNNESKKTMYNAVIIIVKLYRGITNNVYNQYKAIRDGLKAEIREQKSENVVRNENEWMSLDELKAVPDLVKKEIEIKYGSLFLPKTRLS
jgi:hypothetical protein